MAGSSVTRPRASSAGSPHGHGRHVQFPPEAAEDIDDAMTIGPDQLWLFRGSRRVVVNHVQG
ncbi:hypothetical protein ADK59_35520 [Streptomyces sp. XY332]|nr:hypothetical protein ADK59_35520 [Streptomyces sp. XY332]